ncbi:MAG: hypothetical protein ACHQ3P_05025 [Candidatus Limnocylindrales bacterium]
MVVHLANEQPLLADLFDMPGPGDLALICTNLRTMNGGRPVFADDSSSFFVFALSFIRFVEIPPASQREAGLDMETLEALSFAGPSDRGRVAAPPRPSGPPAVRPGDPGRPSKTSESEPELEIDEDFLKRVRDI